VVSVHIVGTGAIRANIRFDLETTVPKNRVLRRPKRPGRKKKKKKKGGLTRTGEQYASENRDDGPMGGGGHVRTRGPGKGRSS